MVFANMAYNPNTIAQLKRHASHLPVSETLFIETKVLTTYDWRELLTTDVAGKWEHLLLHLKNENEMNEIGPNG